MSKADITPPVVVIGGLDPSGGAGLAADIQTLSSLGCHAAPVITAITVQDTVGVKSYEVVSADLVEAQLRTIIADFSPIIMKTGMLASSNIVGVIEGVLDNYQDIELIIDPVMASNSDESLSEHTLAVELLSKLIPMARLITPNSIEAEQFITLTDGVTTIEQLSKNTDYFVTGTHEESESVINRYYNHGRELKSWSWPRLPYEYHGSGCTLASAIAAKRAHGLEMKVAIAQAQEYVFNSLMQGFKAGKGQHIPNRLSGSTG